MTVLLATMSLGIGGAETHIIELALELKRRGVNVYAASNGGIYTADLENAGILHYTVPMNTRSPMAMLKSFFLLRNIIKRVKPDVVHAHARIPGFICGLLNKIMRFNFVTTAHFDFDVGHGLRYLTNWGDKTIAVSEDIKRYLMDNYDIKQKNIIVTINGIDTDKFSPDCSPREIIAEFKLDMSKPVICNVSRLDEHAAKATRQLIEIAPELDRHLPGVQILIAGSGGIYEELLSKAAGVNAAAGRNIVTLTGPRMDISNLLSVCGLFVGVSRAALEAMSVGKPVVLAGNEGFLGLFTPDKLQIAKDTNFCCRGCPPTSRETLLGEIMRYFEIVTESEKKSLGDFGRKLIAEDYSVSKMTDDCVLAYKAFDNQRQNVLLSGYYGFKNAGDEAILQSIHNGITSVGDGVSVTVLSYDPADTISRYGYNAINRFNVFGVLGALRRCDVLVSGGGSLFQDGTSTRSLLYYLFIIRTAKFFGKKVMIYANGIGPVRKAANRRRVRRVVEQADVITLRDSASAAELRAMGVRRDDLHVTADPVFALTGITRGEARNLLRTCGVPDSPFIVVSIREWSNMNGFCEKAAAVCDAVYEEFNLNIVFISMQADKDVSISRTISGKMKNPSYVLESRFMTDELMGIIGASEIVLSMRLHALIFAARMQIPFAGIVYDPKVQAYTQMLSMPSAGTAADFDSGYALETVRDLLTRRTEYIDLLKHKSAGLEESAKSDAAYLLKLLRS